MTRAAHINSVVFLAAVAGFAACSTAPADEHVGTQECFRASQVRGYSVLDRNRVAIRVGASDRYILTTAWNAYDLDWTHRIALRSATGRICTGNGLGVEIIGGEPRRTYPITSIDRAPDAPAQGAE